MIATIIFNIIIVSYLVMTFSKDYFKGLKHALIILIVIPQSMGLAIGALPVLTTHRIIILLCFFYWIGKKEIKKKKIPFSGMLIFIVIANIFSLYFAVFFSPALKRLIGFLWENILFYIIYVSSIKTRKEIMSTLYYLYIGIMVTVFLGVIEQTFKIRPLFLFPAFYNIELVNIIMSTFPHPIFLGLVSGVALLLGFYYLNQQLESRKKILSWIFIFMSGIVLYFSLSRGAWIATLMGIAILFLFAKSQTRKKFLVMFIFLILLFIVKPGVLDTFQSYYDATLNPDSLEGASFYYRFELWIIAFNRISASITRFLFGYGLEYHVYAIFFGSFSFIQGRHSSFHSWDNEFATLLLENGVVGLLLVVIFYGSILMFFFRAAITSRRDKELLCFLFSFVLMYVFMMTNVKMFSTQVLFVFYTIIALGTNLIIENKSK